MAAMQAGFKDVNRRRGNGPPGESGKRRSDSGTDRPQKKARAPRPPPAEPNKPSRVTTTSGRTLTEGGVHSFMGGGALL
jgi:hypothetical protein